MHTLLNRWCKCHKVPALICYMLTWLTRRRGDTSTACLLTVPARPIRVESSRGPELMIALTTTCTGFCKRQLGRLKHVFSMHVIYGYTLGDSRVITDTGALSRITVLIKFILSLYICSLGPIFYGGVSCSSPWDPIQNSPQEAHLTEQHTTKVGDAWCSLVYVFCDPTHYTGQPSKQNYCKLNKIQ